MNRNTNAHFSELPSVDIERSTFDRSHSLKTSGFVGNVIPIFYEEVLPGDTIVMDSSKVIRLQTMLTPMMDNLYADFYYYFVPYRLLWDHWINLMGENSASAWIPQTTYSVPQLVVPPPAGAGDTPNNNKTGTILDYLGFPVGLSDQVDNIKVSALPVRAYCKVMQDWFRDENLTDPINIYTGDSDVTCTTEASYINDLPHGGVPFVACKFADYFTSCLPSPQKGDAVELAIFQAAGLAPVYPYKFQENFELGKDVPSNVEVMHFADIVSNKFSAPAADALLGSVAQSNNYSYLMGTVGTVNRNQHLVPTNLVADLPEVSTTFNVNDLRFAFQMQKLLERDARGGTRYIEVLKAHFNVDSPDQRLQRSEYLGGNRIGIHVDQVCNTAQSQTDFLGDLGAFSVTSDYHSDFTKSFTEHGAVLGVMVLRYDHTYAQGLNKFWTRKNRFDFYWPVFANIGEQPVDKSEIYGTGTGTFGYQEAWADYRYSPNRVTGEMRPYVTNGLSSWSLADSYAQAPSLSDAWIREDKSNVDRVLAVTSSNADQFWADIYFNFKHTRPMPVYSIPGLIDHH